MRDTNLLQLALGLTPPWTVTRSDFDPEAVGSTSRSTSRRAAVPLSQCGLRLPSLRHRQMSWRKLRICVYLNARVPAFVR